MSSYDQLQAVEIQKRMWQILLAGLQQLDPASTEAEEILSNAILSGTAATVPSIGINDNLICCQGIVLDLSDALLTYKVFAAFKQAPQQRISRGDLVKFVYGIDNFSDLSVRRQESLRHNVVKMVSRARKMARAAFDSQGDLLLDWFSYDGSSGLWRLVRLAEPAYRRRVASSGSH